MLATANPCKAIHDQDAHLSSHFLRHIPIDLQASYVGAQDDSHAGQWNGERQTRLAWTFAGIIML
jgi:hypothetical protein